jgi:hypothetical protein
MYSPLQTTSNIFTQPQTTFSTVEISVPTYQLYFASHLCHHPWVQLTQIIIFYTHIDSTVTAGYLIATEPPSLLHVQTAILMIVNWVYCGLHQSIHRKGQKTLTNRPPPLLSSSFLIHAPHNHPSPPLHKMHKHPTGSKSKSHINQHWPHYTDLLQN